MPDSSLSQSVASRVGWALMGLPTGVRQPWPWLLRYGPYRWGAWLANSQSEHSDA